jgi:hypothetical protein
MRPAEIKAVLIENALRNWTESSLRAFTASISFCRFDNCIAAIHRVIVARTESVVKKLV